MENGILELSIRGKSHLATLNNVNLKYTPLHPPASGGRSKQQPQAGGEASNSRKRGEKQATAASGGRSKQQAQAGGEASNRRKRGEKARLFSSNDDDLCRITSTVKHKHLITITVNITINISISISISIIRSLCQDTLQ
ncbi:MAG: hypothetical protein FJY65_10430 [Calditrichaeota bacterium]|nr:hypothetical protein [Calditrichota bacterium]